MIVQCTDIALTESDSRFVWKILCFTQDICFPIGDCRFGYKPVRHFQRVDKIGSQHITRHN